MKYINLVIGIWCISLGIYVNDWFLSSINIIVGAFNIYAFYRMLKTEEKN